MKILVLRNLVLAMIVFNTFSVLAQEEQAEITATEPMDMVMMNYFEAEKVNNIEMMEMYMHQNIELYIPPDIQVKGKKEVLTYWKQKFEKEKETPNMIDLVEFIQGGDRIAMKVRKLDESSGQMIESIILYQIVSGKIYRIFY